MELRDLEDYLDSIADKLGELGGTFLAGPAIEHDFAESTGILTAQIRFATGHRLIVALTCEGQQNFPEWLAYSFQFMDQQDRCVFRYDNSPHHEGGAHFPSHKHVGEQETVADHPKPSFNEVIGEVRSHVYPQQA